MDQRYREKGLVILGFPCNQFLNQEKKPCKEIITDMKAFYNVDFELVEKIEVNGPGAHPIF